MPPTGCTGFDAAPVLLRGVPVTTRVEQEYGRLTGPGRRFIKGQKYALLSRWENLTEKGRKALDLLFNANRRLNRAYLLKEQFGELWSCRTATAAWKFFTRWRDSLKWQRLAPYEKFAAMIITHWDGIVSYCEPDNKVALGFVEGLNNKIRTMQKRAYVSHFPKCLPLFSLN